MFFNLNEYTLKQKAAKSLEIAFGVIFFILGYMYSFNSEVINKYANDTNHRWWNPQNILKFACDQYELNTTSNAKNIDFNTLNDCNVNRFIFIIDHTGSLKKYNKEAFDINELLKKYNGVTLQKNKTYDTSVLIQNNLILLSLIKNQIILNKKKDCKLSILDFNGYFPTRSIADNWIDIKKEESLSNIFSKYKDSILFSSYRQKEDSSQWSSFLKLFNNVNERYCSAGNTPDSNSTSLVIISDFSHEESNLKDKNKFFDSYLDLQTKIEEVLGKEFIHSVTLLKLQTKNENEHSYNTIASFFEKNFEDNHFFEKMKIEELFNNQKVWENKINFLVCKNYWSDKDSPVILYKTRNYPFHQSDEYDTEIRSFFKMVDPNNANNFFLKIYKKGDDETIKGSIHLTYPSGTFRIPVAYNNLITLSIKDGEAFKLSIKSNDENIKTLMLKIYNQETGKSFLTHVIIRNKLSKEFSISLMWFISFVFSFLIINGYLLIRFSFDELKNIEEIFFIVLAFVSLLFFNWDLIKFIKTPKWELPLTILSLEIIGIVLFARVAFIKKKNKDKHEEQQT